MSNWNQSVQFPQMVISTLLLKSGYLTANFTNLNLGILILVNFCKILGLSIVLGVA